MPKRSKIIVIVGPNASGKSELGVKLAKKINGEIISADSRQVYKKLDVGSGKVRGKWEIINGQKKFVYKKIPHYCIDIADPKKVFTALDFKKCAQKAIYDIASRNKTPIIVGGTGFYIDAALGRTKLAGIPPNPKLRKKLSNYSTTQLFNYLTKLDPKRARTIEQKNPRRLVRAIEISLGKADAVSDLILTSPARGSEASAFLLRQNVGDHAKKASETGQKLISFPGKKRRFVIFAGFDGATGTVSPQAKSCANQPSVWHAGPNGKSKNNKTELKIVWLGIKRRPEELKKRIRARLLRRVPGIIREVKKLRRDGLSWKRLYDLGLEYRYASLYLRGKLKAPPSSRRHVGITAKAVTHFQLTHQLTSQSWHYAKRQMTWFKRNKEIRWIKNRKEAVSLFKKTWGA